MSPVPETLCPTACPTAETRSVHPNFCAYTVCGFEICVPTQKNIYNANLYYYCTVNIMQSRAIDLERTARRRWAAAQWPPLVLALRMRPCACAALSWASYLRASRQLANEFRFGDRAARSC